MQLLHHMPATDFSRMPGLAQRMIAQDEQAFNTEHATKVFREERQLEAELERARAATEAAAHKTQVAAQRLAMVQQQIDYWVAAREIRAISPVKHSSPSKNASQFKYASPGRASQPEDAGLSHLEQGLHPPGGLSYLHTHFPRREHYSPQYTSPSFGGDLTHTQMSDQSRGAAGGTFTQSPQVPRHQPERAQPKVDGIAAAIPATTRKSARYDSESD